MKNIYLLLASILLFFCCSAEREDNQVNCTKKTWFRDADQDGLGDSSDTKVSCDKPDGYVAIKKPNVSKTFIIDTSFNFIPGEQALYFLNETKAEYGFALYTPVDYSDDEDNKIPLLVYLHGGGGRGSGSSKSEFNRVIFGITPPSLIAQGNWDVSEPMVVVSPQSSSIWNAEKLHNFIGYLIKNMNVDSSRIYITGLSMGARGVYDYISQYGNQSYVAAAVPIAGWSTINDGRPFKNVPLWAFHGNADNVINVSGSVDMVTAINNSSPSTTAKLTIFAGVNHFSWRRVYDNSGIGTGTNTSDAFDISIYDWMLQFSKK